MQIGLKGGQKTTDPRLDRVVEFDQKSRGYPVRELLAEVKKPRGYTWRCDAWLDQGREGACVGFAWAHELTCRPFALPMNDLDARDIYKAAQKVDEWPGESYSGTSVLAGAKIVKERGYMPEYRWAFGLDDLILAVGYAGPAVLGLNWYEKMFTPNKDGYIKPEGKLMGGHAILCRGVSIKNKYFLLHNSWGQDWGINGTAKISFADMDRLLNERGEAVIPVIRGHKPA